MTKITPGPWAVEEPMDLSLWIVRDGLETYDWDPIAIISLEKDEDVRANDIPIMQRKANARAIAALPDLMEAAKPFVDPANVYLDISDAPDGHEVQITVTSGELRALRSALSEAGQK